MLFYLACLPGAHAAGMVIIRDTEIEGILQGWARPVFEAAGLSTDQVKIIIVQSNELNAFVAGGANIFLYTGLLTAAKNPDEIIGVIAHELGHIAGGHLIRGREAMERASYEAMLATLLGVGAAVAGSTDAGGAIIRGGQGIALGSYLSHSRLEESSADQAALTYLARAGYSPDGLASFLGTIASQEVLSTAQQSAYTRTHPLTRDRIEAMKAGAARASTHGKTTPPAFEEQYARLTAKLNGFISPQRIAWVYGEQDTSIAAQYARAIAAYRNSDKAKALSLMDSLIAREPKNAAFHELKGQMLRDFGDLKGAASAYRQSLSLNPRAPLVQIDFAQVLIELAGQGKRDLYDEAEKNLTLAQAKEPRSTDIQRLFATLYGRMGDEPRARYHLAEKAVLEGRFAEAEELLKLALPGLKSGTRPWRQAQDLQSWLATLPESAKKGDRDRR